MVSFIHEIIHLNALIMLLHLRAIWSAPLYMSNDLRQIKKEHRDILLNKHVIAVNQDQLGIFGKIVVNVRQII